MTINSVAASDPQPPLVPVEPKIAATNRAVSAAVKLLNTSIEDGSSHQFSITIDPVTREAVVRIVDSTTNELIEQLPSEYILKVAQQLSERIAKNSATAVDKTL